MTRLRLSPHFTVEEFDTHDGTKVPEFAEAAARSLCLHWLEPLRREFGPVSVTSGYRHLAYNRRIGSPDGSYHVWERSIVRTVLHDRRWGVAADVVPERGDPRKWVAWAQAHRRRHAVLARRGLGGVGLYVRSGFVHLDTGPRRDWIG